MTDELLVRYISGQVSSDEAKQVADWANASAENMNELAFYRNAWVLSGLHQPYNHERQEQEIQKIIDKINKKTQPVRRPKQPIIGWIGRVAVLLIVALISAALALYCSGTIFSPPTYTEVLVPRGERSQVILPDGSMVHLNSDSKIRFANQNSARKREVELQGEAFFNVVHNPSKPFVVHTPDLSIEVLGTTFNLNCYPNEPAVETYLESGQVKVILRNKKYGEIRLKPSESLQYERSTGKCRKIIYSDSHIIDWTNGVLTVKSETIEALSKKLERRFNIKIQFTDEEVKSHTYTGSIRDGDLLTVLEAIKYASSLEYKRQGEAIVFSSGKNKKPEVFALPPASKQ